MVYSKEIHKDDSNQKGMTENALTIEQAIERIKAGELTTEVLDTILDAHIQRSDSEYLYTIGNSLVKFAKPLQWKKYESSLQIFAQASTEDNKSIQILSSIFEREDMLEFTKSYFMSVSKLFINQPDRIINILLYISSRAAQNSPQFYRFAVKALYSSIVTHLELVNFGDLSSPFSTFIDFQPEATTEPLQEIMTETFRKLHTSLEKKNVDQTSNYANVTFLNLLIFFQPFAFRYDQYKSAFLILAIKSLHEDQSLKINPFRIKIIQMLINTDHYLECVAPLTKILSKSLQEKKSQEGDFDWDQLITAEKEIARNSRYQDILFEKSFDMLNFCLENLKDRICYPEIIAPVVRTIKTIIDSPIFKEKQSILNQFIKDIKKNSKKVELAREKLASEPNFDITQHLYVA